MQGSKPPKPPFWQRHPIITLVVGVLGIMAVTAGIIAIGVVTFGAGAVSLIGLIAWVVGTGVIGVGASAVLGKMLL